MTRPASWLRQFDTETRLRAAYRWLADEGRMPKIQRLLLVVLVLWALNSVSNVVWALVPSLPIEQSPVAVINPPSAKAGSAVGVETIDVSSILGLSVFGPADASETTELPAIAESATQRDGIENGAKETSLALTLTGIVASTSDGFGNAMIEARNKQELYAVGDDLPANGKVTLAKILPKQVVIDNNGTYELITLFDNNAIVGIVESLTVESQASESTPDGQNAADTAASAQERQRLVANYREKLYNDPQSLAGLVSISAVQADGGLKGYRVAPGRDAAQFKALGFQSGDIVTAVNGYALSDPTNTVRLYQMMRDATDAVFEVERDGTPVSISISLSTIQ